LTDSRILKYEAILLERDDFVLTTENYLNPVEFLLRTPWGIALWTLSNTRLKPDLISGKVPFWMDLAACGWFL
jgi:hypothetical protein